VKDLNAILADGGSKTVRRKAQAIEALQALPQFEELLAKHIAFREMFMAVAPAGFEPDHLSATLEYAGQAATALGQTFYSATHCMDWKRRARETPQFHKGWMITNLENPAPACCEPHCKTYSVRDCKFPPFTSAARARHGAYSPSGPTLPV
jgi:hypothetical protein